MTDNHKQTHSVEVVYLTNVYIPNGPATYYCKQCKCVVEGDYLTNHAHLFIIRGCVDEGALYTCNNCHVLWIDKSIKKQH